LRYLSLINTWGVTRTAAAATEAAARDAAQAPARETAALETKVADLERDLGTAMVDLAMASCQFS
jgi:hypothetical protein